MELTLDTKDTEVLKQVLDFYLPQLRGEVFKTENFELRQALKAREEVVKSLIERVNRLAAADR
jgi:hypothetical protein